MVGADVAKIGMGPCMKNKWIKKDGDTLRPLATSVADETMHQLHNLASLSDDDCKNLKRRKLVSQVTRKSYRVTKGPQYAPTRVKRHADITKDMLGNKETV